MIYIVAVSMLITLTAVAVFVPRLPAVLLGYAAMWLCRLGGIGIFGNDTLIFWGVATLIALGITYTIPLFFCGCFFSCGCAGFFCSAGSPLRGRMRHCGPKPIKSSRCASSSASWTSL